MNSDYGGAAARATCFWMRPFPCVNRVFLILRSKAGVCFYFAIKKPMLSLFKKATLVLLCKLASGFAKWDHLSLIRSAYLSYPVRDYFEYNERTNMHRLIFLLVIFLCGFTSTAHAGMARAQMRVSVTVIDSTHNPYEEVAPRTLPTPTRRPEIKQDFEKQVASGAQIPLAHGYFYYPAESASSAE